MAAGTTIIGTSGNDTLTGTAGDDTISGLAGDDLIDGGAGNDSLDGGAGADRLIGGLGNDTIDGGMLTDRIRWSDVNTVSYASASHGVVVDLSGIVGDGSQGSGTASDGDGGTDVLHNIEAVVGSAFADSIHGSSAIVPELFDGGLGDDTIDGGTFVDPLGRDSNGVTYAAAPSAVVVNLSNVAEGHASGGFGSDLLLNINVIIGSAFADAITTGNFVSADDAQNGIVGTDVWNFVAGGPGNDTIIGEGVVDILRYDLSTTLTGVVVNLGTGTASDGFGGTDTFTSIEGVYGSSKADTLIGSNAADHIEYFMGRGGNDVIDGRGGPDVVLYTLASSGISLQFSGNSSVAGVATDGEGGTDSLQNIEGVIGSAFNDTLLGSNLGETFEGGGGNDSIDGGGGVDWVSFEHAQSGGADVWLNQNRAFNDGDGGQDTITNIKDVIGTLLFDDFISGNSDNNDLRGLGGNDEIWGEDGNDSLDGGLGDDTLFGGSGDDVLDGGQGADSMDGGPGDDVIYGDNPDDTLIGGAGDDDFVIDGGGTIDYTNDPGRVIVDLSLLSWDFLVGEDGFGGIDTIEAFSNFTVLGSSFDDILIGSDNVPVDGSTWDHDVLYGGDGNDSIEALDGDDFVSGGNGDDTIDGDAGNDTLMPGAGFDEVFGGDGFDIVSYEDLEGPVAVDLGEGITSKFDPNIHLVVGSDDLSEVEGVVGTNFNDTLRGGTGNIEERFEGLDGEDFIFGGEGVNTASYEHAPEGAHVSLTAQAAFSDGYGSNDVLVNIQDLIGSDGGDDTLLGDANDNQISGLAGNDLIWGGSGDDTLLGGEGDDTLQGEDGNDSLDGGDGSNYLDGGNGDDTFTAADGSDNFVIGGAGDDVFDLPAYAYVSYATSPAAIHVTLGSNDTQDGTASDGFGGTDTFVANGNAVFIEGSPFADHLVGADNGANSLGAFWTYDSLSGGDGNDTIEGRGGSDYLLGGNGNDSIDGGADDDYIVGGDGNDTLIGGSGNDTLFPDAGTNVVDGGDGVDSLNIDDGPAQVDLIAGTATYGIGSATLANIENVFVGGSHNDRISGSNVDNVLQGATGDDTLLGLGGNDRLNGGGGNDSLDGGAGNDQLNGESGDDILIPGGGTDTVDGGDGNDTLVLPFTRASVQVVRGTNLITLTHGSDVVLMSNVETVQFSDGSVSADSLVTTGVTLVGTGGDDTLTGSADPDIISGLGGDDSLIGLGGNDSLDGGPGNDIIIGGAGNDTLLGGAGNDLLRPGPGADSVDGGNGVDTLSYADLTAGGVIVDLSGHLATKAGEQTTDSLGGIENVIGTAFADRFLGDNGNNELDGLAGNDTLQGGGGNDTLDGGDGTDLAMMSATRASFQLLQPGLDLQLRLISNGDTITLRNIESVQFSDQTLSFAQLVAQLGQTLTGTGGDDTLTGGDGNDTLLGLQGSDLLIGGLGNNRLDGGTEDDGSPGFDIASYAGSTAVSVNLAVGTATHGSFNDTLVSIEAIFGSSQADTLRGADGAPTARGETLRGGGGNDTIDGGAGVDTAEWLGPRSDYTITQLNATTWTVHDNNSVNGDEGTDTVTNIERFQFADQMLAFGSRAEELARVASVLWSPAILSLPAFATLFSRGYSFYDVGYSFDVLSQVALQFWTDQNDNQLAQKLVTNSGTSKSVADLLATFTAAGGGDFGRAAMVREVANDPAMLALIDSSGVKLTGIVSDNVVQDFGTLHALLPGG